jgi:hypothetical protein
MLTSCAFQQGSTADPRCLGLSDPVDYSTRMRLTRPAARREGVCVRAASLLRHEARIEEGVAASPATRHAQKAPMPLEPFDSIRLFRQPQD